HEAIALAAHIEAHAQPLRPPAGNRCTIDPPQTAVTRRSVQGAAQHVGVTPQPPVGMAIEEDGLTGVVLVFDGLHKMSSSLFGGAARFARAMDVLLKRFQK